MWGGGGRMGKNINELSENIHPLMKENIIGGFKNSQMNLKSKKIVTEANLISSEDPINNSNFSHCEKLDPILIKIKKSRK